MKKLNKLFAILVAMAMVLALSVVSVFAVDNPTTGTTHKGFTAGSGGRGPPPRPDPSDARKIP